MGGLSFGSCMGVRFVVVAGSAFVGFGESEFEGSVESES